MVQKPTQHSPKKLGEQDKKIVDWLKRSISTAAFSSVLPIAALLSTGASFSIIVGRLVVRTMDDRRQRWEGGAVEGGKMAGLF